MESAPPVNCKHEYVRIYQRKLKGLERRLVATKAYLPVGFKMADFGHLSEGSYCFCTKCRARLFPKRTNADRAAARQALLAKQAAAEAGDIETVDDIIENEVEAEISETADDERETSNSISVDELEVDALELEDLGDTKDEINESQECGED